MSGPRRNFAQVRRGPVLPVPGHLRAPFGWPVVALGPDAPLELVWPEAAASAGGWLRIATAVDDREDRVVAARLAKSGEALGEFELRRCPSLTPCQLRLESAAAAAAQREGVVLTSIRGSRPLWFFGPGLPAEASAWAPHFLADEWGDEKAATFLAALASPASLQPFGWMEGCVLDGLYDLHAQTGDGRFHRALQVHLDAFLSGDGKLVYENSRGEPADGKLSTIETTLPFAVFARADAAHPLLNVALDFWRTHTTAGGAIQDGDMLSAEGAYTVAYPLAMLASRRGDPQLAGLAAAQLRVRRQRLRHEGALWLRCTDRDERTFRNWARGVAWYFLGLVRATEVLHAFMDTGEFEDDVRSMAVFVRGLQRPDGLWPCFLDAPELAADTSGSAGIAAALARGVRAGWLGDDDHAAAKRTWVTLLTRLAPDGLLAGAAPSNRGGEALQRSKHRVLSPMGMGLMGQLAAALPAAEINSPRILSSSARDRRVVV